MWLLCCPCSVLFDSNDVAPSQIDRQGGKIEKKNERHETMETRATETPRWVLSFSEMAVDKFRLWFWKLPLPLLLTFSYSICCIVFFFFYPIRSFFVCVFCKKCAFPLFPLDAEMWLGWTDLVEFVDEDSINICNVVICINLNLPLKCLMARLRYVTQMVTVIFVFVLLCNSF